jgi:dipeptide transport system substrate-binding protein
MALPNPADLEAIANNPDLKLETQPGLNVGFWAFNVEKKPYDDQRVRQALNMAIDKKAILDAVYLGTGINSINPIPPVVLGSRREGLSLRSDESEGASRGGRLS